MNAIAGIVRLDGRDARPDDLRAVLDGLHHRSGTGFTTATQGTAAFASSSAAPTMRTSAAPTSNMVVCHGGEDGRPGGSAADMARAIEEKGVAVAAAERDDDVSFAMWRPHTEELLCGRDHFGIRPFYYRHHPGRFFAFASEARALTLIDGGRCGLDERHIVERLTPGFDNLVSTPWTAIRRLPPAHVLRLEGGTLDIWRYWSLESREFAIDTDDGWYDAVRETLTEAVQRRLPHDSQVGLALSGGLDSSAIAGVIRQSGQGFTPLSVVYRGAVGLDPSSDESSYVRSVEEWTGTNAQIVEGDEVQWADHMRLHLGDLATLPNLGLHAAVGRAGADAGLTVLLSGFEGDVTISPGLEYLSELAMAGRWSAFARVAAHVEERGGGRQAQLWRRHGRPYLGSAAAIHGRSSTLAAARTVAMGRRDRLEVAAIAVGGAAIAQRMATDQRPPLPLNRALLAANTKRALVKPPHPAAIHGDTVTGPLLVYALERFDEASARQQISVRYPFFDRRLIELCVSAPARTKLRDGWQRSLLRFSTEGLMPEDIRWRRSKGTVRLPVRQAACRSAGTIEEACESDAVATYLDREAVRSAWQRLRGDPIGATEADVFTTYLAASLSVFLR